MRFPSKRFWVILWVSFWLFLSPKLIVYLTLSASACIDRQTITSERTGLVNNFRDEAGHVWELVVWFEANDPNSNKKNNKSNIYLRLAGYPLFELDRHQPLKIIAHEQVLFTARDLIPQKFSPWHFAQYNVTEIVPQLPMGETLNLSFSLINNSQGNIDSSASTERNRQVHFSVPPEVIAQWQEFSKTLPQNQPNFSPRQTPFLLAENLDIESSR